MRRGRKPHEQDKSPGGIEDATLRRPLRTRSGHSATRAAGGDQPREEAWSGKPEAIHAYCKRIRPRLIEVIEGEGKLALAAEVLRRVEAALARAVLRTKETTKDRPEALPNLAGSICRTECLMVELAASGVLRRFDEGEASARTEFHAWFLSADEKARWQLARAKGAWEFGEDLNQTLKAAFWKAIQAARTVADLGIEDIVGWLNGAFRNMLADLFIRRYIAIRDTTESADALSVYLDPSNVGSAAAEDAVSKMVQDREDEALIKAGKGGRREMPEVSVRGLRVLLRELGQVIPESERELFLDLIQHSLTCAERGNLFAALAGEVLRELSCHEVAEALGKPVGTYASGKCRALRRLRSAGFDCEPLRRALGRKAGK